MNTAEKEKNRLDFLTEMLQGLVHWTKKGEKEYAGVYQLMLNKFTQLDEPEKENK
jgi:hypothetical protein